MNRQNTITINNSTYVINGERNVLEIARKAGIEIPTFCYHSELSVYGACRMCLVEIEGRGIVTSCSTPPEAGMTIWTNTKEVREIRKINCELLLANHERECTTCLKSGACSLQELSRTMGIDKIRYKPTHKLQEVDKSSPSVIRDPNKCVLCGDCVRFCDEIQSVGAIDFSGRGADATVAPAFKRQLGDVECVDCGQCSRVCPTGAIVPRQEIQAVWDMIDNKELLTVAQVAPAIRVALGEYFGMPAGSITTGKITAALKRIGFSKVYDTSFTADMTVLEEGAEFIDRLGKGENLPLITSCCPAWVKFAEQYHPELLGNLSTCKSPQQMFGSVAKRVLPKEAGVDAKNVRVVSIMPCTAKKHEAVRPEFTGDYGRDVDAVLTSQELGRMIEAAGIKFAELPDEPYDQPFGMATGAGVIFGASGGVTEAVVRFAAHKLTGETFNFTIDETGTTNGILEKKVVIGTTELRAAVVFGLKNARTICREIAAGKSPYQVIEIMACPGGCVNGAGQPATYDFSVVKKRGLSLYQIDGASAKRMSDDNTDVKESYAKFTDEHLGIHAHDVLHTHYASRKRMKDDSIHLHGAEGSPKANIEVCVGTTCCLNGAHELIKDLVVHVDNHNLQNDVSVKAAFCLEKCGGKSPQVKFNGESIAGCTIDEIKKRIATVYNR